MDAAHGVHSALENRFICNVERRHRLPTPERQVVVGPRAADCWYGQFALAIELDGWGYHADRVFLDMRVDNARAELGIQTRHFGWMDVITDPCGVARLIANLLRRGGWTGSLRPCRTCAAEQAA